MLIRVLSPIAPLLLCFQLFSQTYTESSMELGIQQSYQGIEYGCGVSFIDFNKDGLDDLSFGGYGENPKFFMNTQDGFTQSQIVIPNVGDIKQVTWVDFDNDDDYDLFITRFEGSIDLYENTGDLELVNISQAAGFPVTSAMSFGNTWGDYNKDGFLDVYIANYDSDGETTNWLFKNNGDGTFTETTQEAGVSNDSWYSFGGLWVDYDNDGWQDLFVVNDRENASNYMYRNNGDGTFDDVSAELGLDYNIFSMSYTGGDFDNDGDMDLYVSNNPFGHLLHQQNEWGQFDEVANDVGVATYDMGWSGVWMDYDLDGWQDLYIACSPFWDQNGQDKFYRSIEGTSFIPNTGNGISDPGSWSNSAAVGDLNNDGMFDLCVSNQFPDFSDIYVSDQGENNFLRVQAIGTLSNRDGVGTRFTIWVDGKMQTRYTFCGESFLSQNSKWEIFGLGQAEFVDSLRVEWLSGQVDSYYNIAANQSLELIETIDELFEITVNDDLEICEGDSLQLIAAQGVTNIIWSDGSNGQSMFASETGEYSYTGMVSGTSVGSEVVEVIVIEQAQPEWALENVSCNGGSDGVIDLSSELEVEIQSLWINNLPSAVFFPLDNLPADSYTIEIEDVSGCNHMFYLQIEQPDSLLSSAAVAHVECFGESSGQITVTNVGGTPPYDMTPDSLSLTTLAAGPLTIHIEDANGCSNMIEAEVIANPELISQADVVDANTEENGSVDLTIEGGVPPYTITWSESGQQANLTDLMPGEYLITLTDSLGCSQEIDFVIGFTSLEDIGQNKTSLWYKGDNEIGLITDLKVEKLLLFDFQGNLVSELRLNQHQNIIALPEISQGVYVIQLIDFERVVHSQKLLIFDR